MSFRTELSISTLGSQGMHDSYKPKKPQSSLAALAEESFESPPLSASTQAPRKWFSTRNMFIGTVAFIGGSILLGVRYLAPVQTIGPKVPDPQPDFHQQMEHFISAGKFQEAQDLVYTLPQEVQIIGLQQMIRLTAKRSLPDILKTVEMIMNHPFYDSASLQTTCPSLGLAVRSAYKNSNSLEQIFDLSNQGISNNTKRVFFGFLAHCLTESNEDLTLIADILSLIERDWVVVINQSLVHLHLKVKEQTQVDDEIGTLAAHLQGKGVDTDAILYLVKQIKDSGERDRVLFELSENLQSAEQVMKYARLFTDRGQLEWMISYKCYDKHDWGTVLPVEERKKLLMLLHQEDLVRPSEIAWLADFGLSLRDSVHFLKTFKLPLNPNDSKTEELLLELGTNLIFRAHCEGQNEMARDICEFVKELPDSDTRNTLLSSPSSPCGDFADQTLSAEIVSQELP